MKAKHARCILIAVLVLLVQLTARADNSYSTRTYNNHVYNCDEIPDPLPTPGGYGSLIYVFGSCDDNTNKVTSLGVNSTNADGGSIIRSSSPTYAEHGVRLRLKLADSSATMIAYVGASYNAWWKVSVRASPFLKESRDAGDLGR